VLIHGREARFVAQSAQVGGDLLVTVATDNPDKLLAAKCCTAHETEVESRYQFRGIPSAIPIFPGR